MINLITTFKKRFKNGSCLINIFKINSNKKGLDFSRPFQPNKILIITTKQNLLFISSKG